jgi:uncharacterized protein (UPF0332 family)
MTDLEVLFRYRMAQAEETLSDARAMLAAELTPRSVVNRAYYAVFYAVLALLLHEDIDHRTSRHSGVIAAFDRAFVHTGRLDREHSRTLHRLFDARQEADYREFSSCSREDAAAAVSAAEKLLCGVRQIIAESTP